eukprot:387694-Amphidinium_carterae.1
MEWFQECSALCPQYQVFASNILCSTISIHMFLVTFGTARQLTPVVLSQVLLVSRTPGLALHWAFGGTEQLVHG